MPKRLLLAGRPGDCARLAALCERIGIEPAVAADPESADTIRGAALASGACGVYAASVAAYTAAAQAAAAFNWPGPSAAWLERDAHLRLRAAIRDAGLPGPEFCVVDTDEGAGEAVRSLGMPVNVRPGEAFGHPPCIRVDQFEELPLALSRARKHSPGRPVLIERVTDGPVCRLVGFKRRCEFTPVEIVDEVLSRPPYQVPVCVSAPSALSGYAYQRAVDLAVKAMRLMPPGTGMLEVELALNGDGPVLLGVHVVPQPCPVVAEVLRQALGVDIEADALRVAAGEAVSERPSRAMGAAACWITSHSGVVQAVEGVAAARSAAGVCRVEVLASPGHTIGHVVDRASRDAVGYVVAVGAQRESALSAARTASGMVEIITRPALD